MELRVLRYFVTIAREENITKAAEKLNITQPTLSRQLHQLEEEFGKKLFKRGNHDIKLTEDGYLLRKRAEEILDLVEKTESEMTSQDEEISGDIYIGAGETDGYHFSDDDFYIYITTHEYKHYSIRGTGLRSLVDRYVFIKNKELNWNYIESEYTKLGIAEYENESRQLSLKLFEKNPDSVEFTDAELKMLSYYLNSGTYGTLENRVNKAVDEKNGNKAKYLLSRIFPPKSFYRIYFPPSKKYPVLIPFLWIHRMMKGLFTKSKSIKAELKHHKKMDK